MLPFIFLLLRLVLAYYVKGNLLDYIAFYREAQSFKAAHLEVVYAHNHRVCIHQRPPGIARIYRNISLQVDIQPARPCPVDSAHYSLGNCKRKPRGVSQRDDSFPHFDIIGIAKAQGHELGIYLENRYVGSCVVAYQRGVIDFVVIRKHPYYARILYDMVISHDETVAVNNHAASLPFIRSHAYNGLYHFVYYCREIRAFYLYRAYLVLELIELYVALLLYLVNKGIKRGYVL